MRRQRWMAWVSGFVLVVALLSGCKLPEVNAEDRLFLPLSAEYLGRYILNEKDFKDTRIGGISGITYDRQNDLFYALSDDRGGRAIPRFYTLKIQLDETPAIKQVQVQDVTFIQKEDGMLFQPGYVDPEGIALTQRGTLLISSEGAGKEKQPPFIGEFDLKTGKRLIQAPIPDAYVPDTYNPLQARGVQDNRAFESLTVSPGGMKSDPFRFFAAVEAPLVQDLEPPDPKREGRNRLLHYLVERDRISLVSEHLYPLDPKPQGAMDHGLSELLSIDQAGHFLSIERSFGLTGFKIKLYQVTTGAATDTSMIESLKGELKGIQPARKRLLLDFATVNINPDNLEGITFGPRLPDGSQSLILVSDDNFNALTQATQLILLRLKGLKQ
jgi:hypothetical protein